MKRTCKRWYNILVSIDNIIKKELKKQKGDKLEIKKRVYLWNEYNSEKWSMREIYLEAIERFLFGNEIRKVLIKLRKRERNLKEVYKGTISYSCMTDNRIISEEISEWLFKEFLEFVEEIIDGKKSKIIRMLLASKKVVKGREYYEYNKDKEMEFKEIMMAERFRKELENFKRFKLCNFDINNYNKELWCYIYV